MEHPKRNITKLALSPTLRLQLRRKSPKKGKLNWETVHQQMAKTDQIFELKLDESKVLRERAVALARPLESGVADTLADTLVVLQQVNCQLALNVEYVREIIPLESVTYVPGVPGFIVGVVNARGKILTLINLELFLQVGPTLERVTEQKQTIVMVEIGNFEFGVLCEGFPIIGLHNPTHFTELDNIILNYRPQYLQGIDPQGVLMVNLASLVAASDFLVEQS